MKKYIVLLIGILFLMIDVKIETIPYPEFEEFHTEATNTVSMIIDHVIGHNMKIDPVSDIVGYILLAIASLMFIKAYKNNSFPMNYDVESKIRCRKRFGKAVRWCIAGIIVYAFELLVPLWLNGNLRYRSGYGLYILALIIKITVLIMTVLGMLGLIETLENHDFNNKTAIFSLLAIFCTCINRVCWFYDITRPVYWIYYGLSLAFMAFSVGRVIHTLKRDDYFQVYSL